MILICNIRAGKSAELAQLGSIAFACDSAVSENVASADLLLALF